ncbi:unnamed protein product [Peniophora sp. CBMAI 1063]|nr:unnamed protein product [Peniophora sp. CBMAI 1063]
MSEAILQAELAVAKAQLALAQAQEAARAKLMIAVNEVAAITSNSAAGASSYVPDAVDSSRAPSDKRDCTPTAGVEEAAGKGARSANIIEGATNCGNDSTHVETWTKLVEEPFADDARDPAVPDIDLTVDAIDARDFVVPDIDLTSDAELDTQPDVDNQQLTRELAEASEDGDVTELGDKRGSERAEKTRRSSARVGRVATRAILAKEDNAETTESATSASKRKMSATGGQSSCEELEEEGDEVGAGGVLTVALNKGAAPKGSVFEFADSVMRFAAFAFAYASLWGPDHQELVISMIKPLVQLELAHRFELGQEMPGLPPSAISWISSRRAACKVDDPSYVRNALKEIHLEHKMLSCISTLRSVKFADVALMHGRRGYILLVRGMLQARASNILGEDWAPCVGEVARLLHALVRANNGEDMEFSVRDPVLAALTTIDHSATVVVTAILSKRADELKEMNTGGFRSSTSSPKSMKRARRSASASPIKVPGPSTSLRSRPRGIKKARGVGEGSSKASAEN